MASWLGGAVTRQSWNTNGGTFTGGPPKGVLHTTETSSWPGYDGGATCPHFTIRANEAAKRLDIRQHVPVNVAARALANQSGGVQTNRDGAIQIELVGSCNPAWATKAGYFYWPKAPAWALDQLRAFMRRLEQLCGIRPITVSPWLPYPKSYGSKSGQRLSLSQWDAYSGWVGHQHVPENDHGDPGNLDIASLLQRAVPVPSLPVSKPIVVPVSTGTLTAPRYPLASGHVFGPKTGPATQHSGYFGSYDRERLRTWQAQMRRRGWTISVDGLFGSQTASVVKAFQKEKRLGVDGLIGPKTWAAAWTATKGTKA